ncbi:MAG TPA: O-antigen ligase family protein [Bacteroidales bacterium]|nr:O-antigen ligase family protein [Bacteroidales bacterium]
MNELTQREKIHRTLRTWLLYGIAFALPVYGRILPALIALLTLNWLLEAYWLKSVPGLFKEKERLALLAFSALYFLYLAGLLWTSDFPYAWFDLEVKLSLLIFPLIFATSPWPLLTGKESGNLIRIFALGCLTGTLILLGHSIYLSAVEHLPDAFYYSNLSWHFHPSYLSMYLALAVSNILYGFIVRRTVKGRIRITIHVLMLLWLTTFIILLSSKAGLLALLMVILFYALLLGFRFRRWLTAFVFLGISLAVFFAGLQLFPYASSRISRAGKDVSVAPEGSGGTSTLDRLGVWNAALKVIGRQPVFGTGTGDVKDELLKEYRNSNALPALEKKLNAHNQYLQTTVALGILGGIVLAGMLLWPAVASFRKENWLYTVFLLIFMLNITVESMFETQAGVVFYAFFNVVLFLAGRTSPEEP